VIEVRGGYNLSGESLFQDRVRERDLDNFLVEELHSSDRFKTWLMARLNHLSLSETQSG